MQNALLLLIEGHDARHLLHVLPEIPLVQRLVQDDLVQPLELTEGEFLGKQLVDELMVGSVFPDLEQGGIDNLVVVEGQTGQILERTPFGPAGETAGLRPIILHGHEAVIADAHHPAVRVGAHPPQPILVLLVCHTARITKGSELLQKNALKRGQGGEDAGRGLIEFFLRKDQVAWHGHVESVRFHVLSRQSLTDEKDLKLMAIESEDHVVDTHVESRGFDTRDRLVCFTKDHCLGVKSTPISTRRSSPYIRAPKTMNKIQRIGVLTSGGDAPGMNAAIRAVVRAAVFHGIEVTGIFQGYEGLITGDLKRLHARSVAKILGRGGTILKSARCKQFYEPEGRRKGADVLRNGNIDALVVIGGNGTFTGAMKLAEEHGVRVVGIPGTIDNDLAGTDYTIGYDTATNTVVEAVDKIRDTASSHNRLFFVEVMGRDSGYIALKTGIATGAIAVMTPEAGMDIDDLIGILERGEESNKTSSIVIVAEGDANGGAMEIAAKVHSRYDKYDTRVTVLGHIQRGGDPSCFDRVLASRMGVGAVEALLAGQTAVMAGIVNDEVVYTPFAEAINRKSKGLDEELRVAQILSI